MSRERLNFAIDSAAIILYILSMKKGFTLIEIMIVIAVVGILATIAITTFVSSRKTAMKSACRMNMRQLEETVLRYVVDNNGSFPAELNNLTPDYIRKIPVCPVVTDDNTYIYNSTDGAVSCRTTADHTLAVNTL